MGTSTNGQLCFGICFEEDYEFPWKDFDDIQDWWKEINGYKNPFRLFDEEGRSVSRKEEDDYFEFSEKWEKDNPLLFEVVNYCSFDYPMCILAVSSTIRTALRGYPQKLDVEDLTVSEEEIKALTDFCQEYGLKGDGPNWWLSSYWG